MTHSVCPRHSKLWCRPPGITNRVQTVNDYSSEKVWSSEPFQQRRKARAAFPPVKISFFYVLGFRIFPSQNRGILGVEGGHVLAGLGDFHPTAQVRALALEIALPGGSWQGGNPGLG